MIKARNALVIYVRRLLPLLLLLGLVYIYVYIV